MKLIAEATTVLSRSFPVASAIPAVRSRLSAFNGQGMPGHIALTFNDGPDPASTPALLELLAAHDVRATFFVLGSLLGRSPRLGQEIVAAGHEIAVHGWHHGRPLHRGPTAIDREITYARAMIIEATGVIPVHFRPPGGLLTRSALRAADRLGLQPVLWTASGSDRRRLVTSDQVARTVLRDLRSGGVVLLHDADDPMPPGSRSVTLGALPSLLECCHQQGWRVGPLNEHYGSVRAAG